MTLAFTTDTHSCPLSHGKLQETFLVLCSQKQAEFGDVSFIRFSLACELSRDGPDATLGE